MKKLFILSTLLLFAAAGCCKKKNVVEESFGHAAAQLGFALSYLDELSAATPDSLRPMQRGFPRLTPRTIDKDGALHLVSCMDWTVGYFPGSLWYLYEYTGDEKWREAAEHYTDLVGPAIEHMTNNHDIGVMVGDSYGNGYRLTGNPAYRDSILRAADRLVILFNPNTGVIQSWPVSEKQDRKAPTIIDNMIVLEPLFTATKLTGDSSYLNIAVTHALTTIKNHFREDYSSYHLVDYDPETGEVRKRVTVQGYADDSRWARGQAWGLNGYSQMYRETGNPVFLEQAERIAEHIFNYPTMPEDLIPYWDYNAPNIPDEPRDASAAALAASALYEMAAFNTPKREQYLAWADKIIESLSSPAYRAPLGTHYGFLLLHSTGFKPRGNEVDVPLNYADFYFLQALMRKRGLEAAAQESN